MKINRVLIVIILLLLCCSFLFIKETGDTINISYMLQMNKYDGLKDYWNERITGIPAVVKTIFGDERMNVYVKMKNGKERVVGIVTDRGHIIQIRTGGITDPTLNVYSSEDTFNQILNKKLNINSAMDNGLLKYTKQTK